jgi:hypothetical protein
MSFSSSSSSIAAETPTSTPSSYTSSGSSTSGSSYLDDQSSIISQEHSSNYYLVDLATIASSASNTNVNLNYINLNFESNNSQEPESDMNAEPEYKKVKLTHVKQAMSESSSKISSFISNKKLEDRIGSILCCTVCLDLPQSAIYQVNLSIHFFGKIFWSKLSKAIEHVFKP